MLKLEEKIDNQKGDFQNRYYDIKIAQERFNLPNIPTSFLHELFLLSYYCLRDKRFRQISSVTYKLINQIKKVKGDKEYTALLVTNALIELGPTFIKIGQLLSTRSDLLPNEYIEAFSQLQDSLPPLSFTDVKPVIETEFKKPVIDIFEYFNEIPMASASIGQVHKAKLKSGQEVVVKVQRPDLSTFFYQDLGILRCIATFLERYAQIGKDKEWVEIIDEIGKTLFEEIDFIQEGRNADRLRKNLKYEERIYIPKIFWRYVTRTIITIEFVPGIKITDVESLTQNNFNPKELALILVNAYFKQVFEDGFYHADPHPGNIVVKNDGTIVFYDFGMVGKINEAIRSELANVLVSIIGNDTDTLLATLKKLELIKSDVDITPLKRIIEDAAYKYYDGAKLDSLDFNRIENDLKKVFEEKPMKLPSKFTYTLRATGTLEGVCKTLDPDFSLVSAASPFVQKWIKDKVPESTWKWVYLKALFPNQSKLIDKIKIYVDVIKDLPKYVSNIEENKLREKQNIKISEEPVNSSNIENKSLEELEDTKLKLNIAYSVIFFLCFVLIGNYLVENGNTLISIFGLMLLCSSLFGSISIVAWSIFRK